MRNPPSQFGIAGLDVFGSDDKESEVVGPLAHEMQASSNTSYRGASDEDNILWSRWDKLRGFDGAVDNMRRLLFLGYSMGLQIWDCTNLVSVTEIIPGLHETSLIDENPTSPGGRGVKRKVS